MNAAEIAALPTPRTDEVVEFIKRQLSADSCDTDHPYYVLDVATNVSRRLERENRALQDALRLAIDYGINDTAADEAAQAVLYYIGESK